MVISLSLLFVNLQSFFVPCRLLGLLAFHLLSPFPLAFIDSWKVELDNPTVDVHWDTVYCLDVLFCHVRCGKGRIRMVIIGSGTGTLNALHRRARAKSLAVSTSNQTE